MRRAKFEAKYWKHRAVKTFLVRHPSKLFQHLWNKSCTWWFFLTSAGGKEKPSFYCCVCRNKRPKTYALHPSNRCRLSQRSRGPRMSGPPPSSRCHSYQSPERSAPCHLPSRGHRSCRAVKSTALPQMVSSSHRSCRSQAQMGLLRLFSSMAAQCLGMEWCKPPSSHRLISSSHLPERGRSSDVQRILNKLG